MSGRILVLDDDELFADSLITLLDRSGFEPMTLAPGSGLQQRLLRAHREQPIRLLFVDLFMPEPDGFEIMRFAQRRLPGVPIIGMSGKDGPLLEAMRMLGAEAVFQKPIEPTRLVGLVHQLLREPG